MTPSLQNHVVSLPLAKRMRELGFPQGSLFYWMRAGADWLLCFKHDLGYQMQNGMVIRKEVFESNEHCSAYTVSELGDILPAYILNDEGMRFKLDIWKDAGWHVAYWWDEDTRRGSDMKIEVFLEANEADARAKMRIYLKENGLI